MSQDIGNTIDGEANRPYHFESEVWGQSLELYVQNGMLLVTASDFDSGQTVRIGLKAGQIDAIIKGLGMAVADADALAIIKQKKEDAVDGAKAKYQQAKHTAKLIERATRGERLTANDQLIVDEANKETSINKDQEQFVLSNQEGK